MENETRQQKKWTIGMTSLALLGASAFGLMMTVLLTYIPRDNEFRAILTWLGLIVGFSYIYVGIPLLIAAFIVGIVAIAKNSGRQSGVITLSGIMLSAIALMTYLLLK